MTPYPPVIALLVGRSPEERFSLHRGYVESVVAVGGLPVLVPAGDGVDLTAVVEWIGRCQGLILTGGGDVDPARYGGETPKGLMEVDAARDAVEIAAACSAMDAGQRVLGICRGVQLLAVATGGALIGDVASAGYDGHWAEDRQYEPVHGLKTEPGSLAERALGGAATVNSIHHQAVGDPGPALTPTAWAPDGLIEAVEAPGVLGVQWHPERLAGGDPRYLAPFRWVVQG
jgi:putative glutamine amidotransferase